MRPHEAGTVRCHVPAELDVQSLQADRPEVLQSRCHDVYISD